jgi:hypothetical protein
MRFYCLVCILLIISIVHCEAAEQKRKEISYNVSIIRLIASPEKYDGKRVTVRGFLKLEFEGDALYLHREDYERSLVTNSVGIILSKSQIKAFRKYDRQYVVLSGVFSRCDETQFVCVFSGDIDEINDHIALWPLRSDKSHDEPRK